MFDLISYAVDRVKSAIEQASRDPQDTIQDMSSVEQLTEQYNKLNSTPEGSASREATRVWNERQETATRVWRDGYYQDSNGHWRVRE